MMSCSTLPTWKPLVTHHCNHLTTAGPGARQEVRVMALSLAAAMAASEMTV
ncbi:hypothetical protein GA0074695_4068 [Micromonospora viridifaciens]|uniref:Uncharacterized protein n=1 Tax=Micromonospora viridifaciens TaxID=1881 RepID=A0A1C4YBJ0_MICVI|nr:hypothetical protein GA0074695_4068 [Micromonospora viridifaciens]